MNFMLENGSRKRYDQVKTSDSSLFDPARRYDCQTNFIHFKKIETYEKLDRTKGISAS